MDLTKAFEQNRILKQELSSIQSSDILTSYHSIVKTLDTLSNLVPYNKTNIQSSFSSVVDFFLSVETISNILDVLNVSLPINNAVLQKRTAFFNSMFEEELNFIEPFFLYSEFIHSSQIDLYIEQLRTIEIVMLESGLDKNLLLKAGTSIYNSEFYSNAFYIFSDGKILFSDLIGSEVKFGIEMGKIIDKINLFIYGV